MKGVSASIVEAGMLAMRETREQLRAIRKELEHQVLGTPELRAEAEELRLRAAVLDRLSAYDGPPTTELRGWKRHRLARKLRGR